MRRLTVTLASLVAALAVAGCSGGAASGRPAEPSTPAPTMPAMSATPASPASPTSPASPASPAPSDASVPSASSVPAAGMDHGSMSPIEVTIVDFAFEPAEIEVAAGQTVVWTNEGGQPHTVRSEDGQISSAIILAEPFRWTAEGEPGTSIPYVCGIHPAMTGTITITE